MIKQNEFLNYLDYREMNGLSLKRFDLHYIELSSKKRWFKQCASKANYRVFDNKRLKKLSFCLRGGEVKSRSTE